MMCFFYLHYHSRYLGFEGCLKTHAEASLTCLAIQEISNEISEALAQVMSNPLPSEISAAQEKVYVTYTSPSVDTSPPALTLLEARWTLGSSGTTGFRTWEAALHLASYLYNNPQRHPIANRNVIELGAGTGLVSILCAKYLMAAHVSATDGSPEVVGDLDVNMRLNGMTSGGNMGSHVLKWGHSLIGGIFDWRVSGKPFDLVLGADVVSCP